MVEVCEPVSDRRLDPSGGIGERGRRRRELVEAYVDGLKHEN